MNTENTIPEADATIHAQLDWLAQGKRRAALLTPGTCIPKAALQFEAVVCTAGVIFYRPDLIGKGEVMELVQSDRIGDLLSFGIGRRPVSGPENRVVVVRDENGVEKQAVVTDPKNLRPVLEAAAKVKDNGDTVQVEKPEETIADRLLAHSRAALRIRPLATVADAERLRAAAKADHHRPLNATHLIERDGEVIGCIGINSLPLFRLWLDSKAVKPRDTLEVLRTIEHRYSMEGATVLATVVHPSSPLIRLDAHMGYVTGGDVLYMKFLS